MVSILTRAGADKPVDMDELLKREALDVIGQPSPSCLSELARLCTHEALTLLILLLFCL